MALHHILRDFMGSQDGRFAEAFKVGTTADLSDYLVGCVPPDWIRRIDAAPAVPPAPTSVARKAGSKKSADLSRE